MSDNQLSMLHTVKVKTIGLSVYWRCIECEVTLQNPRHWPTDWLATHSNGQPVRLPYPLGDVSTCTDFDQELIVSTDRKYSRKVTP